MLSKLSPSFMILVLKFSVSKHWASVSAIYNVNLTFTTFVDTILNCFNTPLSPTNKWETTEHTKSQTTSRLRGLCSFVTIFENPELIDRYQSSVSQGRRKIGTNKKWD